MLEIVKNLLFGSKKPRQVGTVRGRRRFADVAIPFRMGAGAPGDVNRTHPASIPPFLVDPTNPPVSYGVGGVIVGSSGGLRGLSAGDTALVDIDAITVRPYPIQQQSATHYGAQGFGPTGIATSQPIDGLVSGYIMVQLPAGQSPNKGDAVNIWIAASTGSHVQGGFEATATGGSTITLTSKKTYFNSPADANGVAEIAFNV